MEAILLAERVGWCLGIKCTLIKQKLHKYINTTLSPMDQCEDITTHLPLTASNFKGLTEAAEIAIV